MSLTEKDIKALSQSTSKRFRIALSIVMPLITIFFLFVGIMNLWVCSRFADMAGLSILQVFEEWMEGIDLSRQYSGVVIMAIQRLQTGLTQIIMAILVVFIFIVRRSVTNRNIRILKFIEEKSNNPTQH